MEEAMAANWEYQKELRLYLYLFPILVCFLSAQCVSEAPLIIYCQDVEQEPQSHAKVVEREVGERQ